MTVQPGRSLLHYRIVEKIGEGGMGAVYRARDTSLDREVAVKVLPQSVAADAERLARFEREAKLLASLNHPNIASVYGLHEAEGVRFFAMELVDGEDLAERLSRGPMPTRDALRVARRVADALDAAHDRGVIHRDLKPANVKIASDGKVKVLDFGLAKELTSAADSPESPTVTSAGSRAGVVLGTAAYMSPEQARGEQVDQRTDLWAFGCLVYEMLTGTAPFGRGSITDTLAAVVRDEPDLTALPADSPAGLRRMLRHCLAKDRDRRLRHAGDALLNLDDVEDAVSDTTTSPPAAKRSASGLGPWIIAFVAVAALVAALVMRTGGEPTSGVATRTDLRLTGMEAVTNRWGAPPITLSPDGRSIVYVFNRDDGGSLLAVRSFDSYQYRLLPGTDGAKNPFYSDDGEWVGFFTDRELRKVQVSGQSPSQLLHSFTTPVSTLGAAWTPDQHIIFGVERLGLLEIPASGGEPAPLTVPDVGRGELHHGFPFVLPGGRELLFTVGGGVNQAQSRPAVLSRDSGEWETLLPEGQFGTQPHYSATGHLVYSHGSRILAAPFDLASRRSTTAPTVVVDDLDTDLGSGVVTFGLSQTGTLVYLPAVRNRLVWVDRRGRVTPLLDEAGDYLHPRLSPVGNKVALLVDDGVNTDVRVIDVERKSEERLTLGGDHSAPLWFPVGETVTFGQNRVFATGVMSRRADGSGEALTLLEDGHENWPMSWSPDGSVLIFDRRTDGGDLDIWASRPGDDEAAFPVFSAGFNEESARFSPDGKWIAYVSDRTGDYEVYVATFPDLDRRLPVSSGGGVEPVWGRDGKELFYRDVWKVLAVSVKEQGGELVLGRPELLFTGFYNRSYGGHAHYDVSPDGQRFVMVEEAPEAFEYLRIVQNWSAELEPIGP